eukprot:1857832-Amphidinium_carterae.1
MRRVSRVHSMRSLPLAICCRAAFLPQRDALWRDEVGQVTSSNPTGPNQGCTVLGNFKELSGCLREHHGSAQRSVMTSPDHHYAQLDPFQICTPCLPGSDAKEIFGVHVHCQKQHATSHKKQG